MTYHFGPYPALLSAMRRDLLLPLMAMATLAAPLRADDPACLLFHSTVPNGTYSGSAAVAGGPGGVLDRCSTFSAATPWQLSHAKPAVSETVLLTSPGSGFGFWIGAKAWMSLRFFQGEQEQFSTGWFTAAPVLSEWWEWQGSFDRVEVSGVHVLMLYGLDLVPDEVVEPLLEPEEEFQPEVEEFLARIGADDPELQAEMIATTVPEPATLTLLASGLVGMAGAARRKRQAKSL